MTPSKLLIGGSKKEIMERILREGFTKSADHGSDVF